MTSKNQYEGPELSPDVLDHAQALADHLREHPDSPDGREALKRVLEAVASDGDARLTVWTWDEAHPPAPRRWIVHNWLPAGRVGLLTGQGGAGKSRLAVQLAAGVASGGGAGGAWLDTPDPDILPLGNAVPPEGAPVLVASWEDEPEEQFRRLSEISGNAAPWVTPPRLHGLAFADLAGLGPVWGPLTGRHIATAAGLSEIGINVRRLAEELDAKLLILDPLAAAYGGDENVRGLVRAFVGDWDKWAREHDCAVLLLAHPPKSGADYSGSTDWEGAARSLWKLEKKIKKDISQVDQVRVQWTLKLVKSNYGPIPDDAVVLALDATPHDHGLRWRAIGTSSITEAEDSSVAQNRNGQGKNDHSPREAKYAGRI